MEMWLRIILGVLSGAAGALILLITMSIIDRRNIKHRAEEEAAELIKEVMYMREILESLKPGEKIASRNAVVVVDEDGNMSGWFSAAGGPMMVFNTDEKE